MLPETREGKGKSPNSKLNPPGSPPPYTVSSPYTPSSSPPPSYKAVSSRSSSPTPISTPPSELDPELGNVQHGQASSPYAHQPSDSPDSPKKRRGCCNRKVAWILGIFILLGIVTTIVCTCIIFIPRRGREGTNTEAVQVVETQPQPQPERILASEPHPESVSEPKPGPELEPEPEPEAVPEPELEPVVEKPAPEPESELEREREPVQEPAHASTPDQVQVAAPYPAYVQTCTHVPLLGWFLSWLDSAIC